MASAVSEPLLRAPAVLLPGERKPPAGPTGRVLWGLRPNQCRQPTGRMGAGRRSGGALRWRHKTTEAVTDFQPYGPSARFASGQFRARVGQGQWLSRPFLTAAWRYLALLNFEVPPALLGPLVPVGTEFDTWGGIALASMVGFRFLDTRVLGIPIPGHRDFDEVNLRLYVRHRCEDGGWRRAVVFVRELVPRRAIATVARWFYNEPYTAVPNAPQTRDGRGGGWRVWACGVRMALGRTLASPRSEYPRVALDSRPDRRGGVHLGALLGLHGPARRGL